MLTWKTLYICSAPPAHVNPMRPCRNCCLPACVFSWQDEEKRTCATCCRCECWACLIVCWSTLVLWGFIPLVKAAVELWASQKCKLTWLHKLSLFSWADMMMINDGSESEVSFSHIQYVLNKTNVYWSVKITTACRDSVLFSETLQLCGLLLQRSDITSGVFSVSLMPRCLLNPISL